MPRRDAILGVLALLLLVGGVLLSRQLTSTRRPAASGQELDLSRSDGELVVDDLHVAIAAFPRPVQPMQPLQLALAFRRGPQPVQVETPRLSFHMVMDMGPHDYALTRGPGDSWLASNVVLPVCSSGSRLWFGTLRFSVDGQPRQGQFRLELQPSAGPESPPPPPPAAPTPIDAGPPADA